MDMPGRMIRLQNEPFYIRCVEVKHARFMVIDPNDGMIVMFAHGIGPFLAIFWDRRTSECAPCLGRELYVSSDVIARRVSARLSM